VKSSKKNSATFILRIIVIYSRNGLFAVDQRYILCGAFHLKKTRCPYLYAGILFKKVSM